MEKSEGKDEDHGKELNNFEKEEVLDVITPNYITVVIMKMFAERSGMSEFCSELFMNQRNFEVEFDLNINKREYPSCNDFH